jgi:hypothetical protein
MNMLRLPIAKIALVSGLVILLTGLALLIYGLHGVPVAYQQPKTKTKTLYDNILTVNGGDYEAKSFNILANRTVKGEFTAEKELANFYVLNSTSYKQWKGTGEPGTYIIHKKNPSNYSFSFQTKNTDTYYFIFDNRHLENDKDITFRLLIQWTEIETQYQPNYNYALIYIGVALMTTGGVLVGAGLVLHFKIKAKP